MFLADDVTRMQKAHSHRVMFRGQARTRETVILENNITVWVHQVMTLSLPEPTLDTQDQEAKREKS